MSARIVLNVKSGGILPRPFLFVRPTRCVIGRGSDCPLQLPEMEVSRHHCELEVDPPTVRVRDLGSRNGTYVNGVLIGRRDAGQSVEIAEREPQPAMNLLSGDQLQVGGTVFEVEVFIAEPENDNTANRGELVMG